jgi:hypothetical protein
MDGSQIADLIETLIDAKVSKHAKVAEGNWTSLDEQLNKNFVAKAKAELAELFPKKFLL